MPPPSFLHPQKRFDVFPIIQVSPAVMQVVGRGWSSAKSESVQIITGLPGQEPASELSDISHGGPQVTLSLGITQEGGHWACHCLTHHGLIQLLPCGWPSLACTPSYISTTQVPR